MSHWRVDWVGYCGEEVREVDGERRYLDIVERVYLQVDCSCSCCG